MPVSSGKGTSQASAQAMKPVTEDAVLKVAKEVVVKFIEVGRLSPANFDETFKSIYKSVKDSVHP